MPLDEKISTGKTTVPHNGLRLVKRRRAMMESNPPRNSQLETHPDDERGRQPQGIGVKIRTFSCHNVSIGVGFEAPKPARLGLILTPMQPQGWRLHRMEIFPEIIRSYLFEAQKNRGLPGGRSS